MKIKVMTLNIWHGGRLWDNAIDFIRSEDPDILLLQEAYNDHNLALEPRFRTIDEFKRLFQFVDSDFALALLFVLDFGKVEEGNAIFSKFPIIDRHQPIFFNEPFSDNYVDVPENFPTSPRNLQHVMINAQGTLLDIFNFQGVWDLDGDNDSPKRQKMVDTILAATKGLPNVILGGDTNARPTNASMRRLEPQLHNIFGEELATTFNVGQKDLKKFPGYAESVVDMLLVSPTINVLNRYCPNVDVSDHLPLVAELEIK